MQSSIYITGALFGCYGYCLDLRSVRKKKIFDRGFKLVGVGAAAMVNNTQRAEIQ